MKTVLINNQLVPVTEVKKEEVIEKKENIAVAVNENIEKEAEDLSADVEPMDKTYPLQQDRPTHSLKTVNFDEWTKSELLNFCRENKWAVGKHLSKTKIIKAIKERQEKESASSI